MILLGGLLIRRFFVFGEIGLGKSFQPSFFLKSNGDFISGSCNMTMKIWKTLEGRIRAMSTKILELPERDLLTGSPMRRW